MVEQRVLALGTGLQGFWLLSAARCHTESCKDPNSSSDRQRKMTNRIIALFTRICLSQAHKGSDSASSDTHLARYITQIQQTSEYVGAPSSENSLVPLSVFNLADNLGVSHPSLMVRVTNFHLTK